MYLSPLNRLSPLGKAVGGATPPPVFNPLTITGLQLYLAKNNATVSSWLDQSANAFDFVQATGTKQPTISANSVDFDGVDDIQIVNAVQPLNDASGIIFFSGYFDSSAVNGVIASGDAATTNIFQVVVTSTGALRFYIVTPTITYFDTTNVITNGDYYYGYIKSTGTSYEASLNGFTETLIFGSGSNDGTWFSDVLARDNLTLGAFVRNTTGYRLAKTNKIIYSNAALTSGEIADIDTFMSVPTNY